MSSETQKLKGIVSLTPGGDQLGAKLLVGLGDTWHHYDSAQVKNQGGVKALFESKFQLGEAWVFIGASGIAVRAVASLLIDKFSDPALVVMDEAARFAISLLSGHAGGANALCYQVAKVAGAMPVVTTATDVLGVASLDLVLKALLVRLADYRDLILEANAALASGEGIALWVDDAFLKLAGLSDVDWRPQVPGLAICQDGASLLEADLRLKIYVGTDPKVLQYLKNKPVKTVIPRAFVLGTGTKKDLETAVYQEQLSQWLREKGLCPEAIDWVGSIGLKASETCLLESAQRYGWQMRFMEAETLLAYEGYFDVSDWVKQTTGVGSVSGPAALHLLSGKQQQLIGDSFKGCGCTFTLGRIHS